MKNKIKLILILIFILYKSVITFSIKETDNATVKGIITPNLSPVIKSSYVMLCRFFHPEALDITLNISP